MPESVGVSHETVRLGDRDEAVAGIGTRAAGRLRDKLRVVTIRDLIEHYPRRHRDLGDVVEVTDVGVGDDATLIGEVLAWTRKLPRDSGGPPRRPARAGGAAIPRR